MSFVVGRWIERNFWEWQRFLCIWFKLGRRASTAPLNFNDLFEKRSLKITSSPSFLSEKLSGLKWYISSRWALGLTPRWTLGLAHKDVGTLYFRLGLWSGLMGWTLSFYMRMELIRPGNWLGSGQLYNSLVTSHAIIIIFFFLMPVTVGGFGNWVVPLA